jgi:transaldolase
MQPEAASARRAVFLDRDGVLNRAFVIDGRPHPPATVGDLEILPGVQEACTQLRRQGYLLVVVTNQPDIARGTLPISSLDAIHARLQRQLHLDSVWVCPHDDDDRCACRKPAPGLLLQAAAHHHIDLRQSFLVGDRWRDIEAGRAAGCRTAFVNRSYHEPQPAGFDAEVGSLLEAAAWICQHDQQGRCSNMADIRSLRIKIFADGADLDGITRLAQDPLISGFTTNPTLMRKAGVVDYADFAARVLEVVPDRPISFEVFSDEEEEMERQAKRIAGWGDNVYVKVPVTNTAGLSTAKVVRRLTDSGVRLNVTAILSLRQVHQVVEALNGTEGAIVSVFAGRVADTGQDPVPLMTAALQLVALNPRVELLWASPRELLNIVQADLIGCHIITVTHDLLLKLPGLGRGLDEVSLDTVRMFHRDAAESNYHI